MACQACGERGGQTRCEGCQKLFCIMCIQKHYDGLVDKFNSIADSRNELKEVINAMQSVAADGSGWLITSEIDQWERNTIKHIQEIGLKLRNDVKTIMRATVNGMETRLNNISRLVQETQEKQTFSEHHSLSLERHIKELREEINNIERNIRFHTQRFNNLDWDSLIFIADNTVATSPDQVQRIPIDHNGSVQMQRWSTDQQLYPPTKPDAAERAGLNETRENIQQKPWSSQRTLSPTLHRPTTPRKTCRICQQNFEYLSSTGACRGCDSRQGILKNNAVSPSQLNYRSPIRNRSAAELTGSFTRDGTQDLFPHTLNSEVIPMKIQHKIPIICSNCRAKNSASLTNSSERRCRECHQSLNNRWKKEYEDEV